MKNACINRRIFLKSSLMAAAGVAALQQFPYHLFAGESKKFAHDIVALGKTGIKVSRLAMGTGSGGYNKHSKQTRLLGVQGVADLFEEAFDYGVMFWDTADQYGSHPHIREALKRVPREKVVILTKTHASTAKEMESDLDRFRKEIGSDYIDIILLHNMTNPNWPRLKKGAMDFLSQAREHGLIRAHGVSCHTIGALRAAAATDWVQVDLARINPYGLYMDGAVPDVLQVLNQMKRQGKGVIGMKIIGAGKLTTKIDESLQYVMGQSSVDCFSIGMTSTYQFNDIVRRIPAASVRG